MGIQATDIQTRQRNFRAGLKLHVKDTEFIIIPLLKFLGTGQFQLALCKSQETCLSVLHQAVLPQAHTMGQKISDLPLRAAGTSRARSPLRLRWLGLDPPYPVVCLVQRKEVVTSPPLDGLTEEPQTSP